ncbi:barttin [Rhinoraja longicauda]
MAEDKTFCYSLIVLGFFLIMVGMFIMNVDKPGVYATFCSIGILMIIVGIIWSICQCYAKIKPAPAFTPDTERLFQLKHQIPGSMSECGVPLKTSSQPPYTTCEEATQCEQTLPIYEMSQLIVSSDVRDVQSPPTSLQPQHLDAEGHSSLDAEVQVHKDSVNNRATCSSWSDITFSDGNSAGGHTGAPLATFHEGNGMVSPSSSENASPLRYRSELPFPSRNKGQSHPTRSQSVTFIDAECSDGPRLCDQPASSTAGSGQRDVASNEMPLPFKLEQSTSNEGQKREDRAEDEMFYGIYGERNHIFEESHQEEYCSDEIPM